MQLWGLKNNFLSDGLKNSTFIGKGELKKLNDKNS